MSSNPKLSISYILRKPVSEYMEDDVITLNENADTSVATSMLQRYNKTDIVIINKNRIPVGIVTDQDILKVVSDPTIYAEDTKLNQIMTFPVFTVNLSESLKDSLQIMRDKNIKKLPVVDNNNKIQGIIFQSTISRAIRASAVKPPRLLSPPLKAILGNLGFVLQFSGFLIMIPAVLAFFLNDNLTAASIFFTSVLLLIIGFFLNSYGEKAHINLQQASILVFLSYVILILFGTIPYISVAPIGDSYLDIFSNSFFSSAAGFTTGGISFYENPEELSQSFTFFRSFSQMVGGMSFIYLVMTAFYPERKLKAMRGFISGKTLKLRELFGTISIIFFSYIVVMVVLLYLIGQQNVIDNFSLAMSTVSTGGFVPSSDILSSIGWQGQTILMGGMILGALPFTLHYAFFRPHYLTEKLGTEVKIFFILLIVSVIVFFILEPDLEPINILFDIVSAGTTAGIQIENFENFGLISKYFITLLMIVGGCGFSTAGGIKIYRFLEVWNYTKNSAKNITKKKEDRVKSPKNELISNVIVISAFPIIIFLIAMHLTEYGFQFTDAIVDATGIVTTGGLSTGIITENLSPLTKILLSFMMIVGRLEIIAIVYIFVRKLGD